MTLGATTQSLHVQVPFSFIVAGKQFAAGEYFVHETENGLILIQGNGLAAAVLSVPGGVSNTGNSGLVFRTLGTKEYLIEVREEGDVNRSIPLHLYQRRKLTFEQ